MSLGDWCYALDFAIMAMDDYPMVLGMDFFNRANVVPILFIDTMWILEGMMRRVPLKRKATLKEKKISSIKLAMDEGPCFKQSKWMESKNPHSKKR